MNTPADAMVGAATALAAITKPNSNALREPLISLLLDVTPDPTAVELTDQTRSAHGRLTATTRL
jgi:hypothetical protein